MDANKKDKERISTQDTKKDIKFVSDYFWGDETLSFQDHEVS